MLQLVPTIIEFVLVMVVLVVQFDWRYAGIVAVMIVTYLAFTYKATEWRIAIRRRMNE